MAVKKREVEFRECDFGNCEREGVGTCQWCGSDCCEAHFVLINCTAYKADLKKQEESEEKTPKMLKAERVEWVEKFKKSLELCHGHANLWKRWVARPPDLDKLNG